MCERSPLFLIEAKSIISNLLKRTFELFDLSLHFVEFYRLKKFLSERDQKRDYRHFSLHKPCQLNYNIISDLDRYLQRLYNSCRLTKSHLRSLHAARMTSSNDYIVIDDEIYELINIFKSKVNNLWRQFQSSQKEQEKIIKIKQSDQIVHRRYNSQRSIHSSQTKESFVFLPETSNQKNNSQKTISSTELQSEQIEEYRHILILFRKISQFYQLLVEQLYGIHIVRDSHILQPMVISIIRLLLLITNKLKQNVQIISPIKINRNRFSVQQHEEMCRVQEKIFKTDKSKFKFIEIHPDISTSPKSESNQNLMEEKDDKSIQSNYLTVRNDNRRDSQSLNTREGQESILDFDEDEFYRLANLERDN